MQHWWPIFLIVVSNVLYNLCAKLAPAKIHPLASLTVTYTVAALTSALLYMILSPKGNLFAEYRSLSFSVVLFGFALVGLEAGYIYMYKAGWPISVGQIVQSGLLTVCLLLIGTFFFHETLTTAKVCAILLILGGLWLLNH